MIKILITNNFLTLGIKLPKKIVFSLLRIGFISFLQNFFRIEFYKKNIIIKYEVGGRLDKEVFLEDNNKV